MSMLLCSRPHIKDVDFKTARFVVGSQRGLDVGSRHYERGEEVPNDILPEEHMREAYDRPNRQIETIEYAFADPDLRTECLSHGVSLGEPEPPPYNPPVQEDVQKSAVPDLDQMSLTELRRLCNANGIPDFGNANQLRRRLSKRFGE